MDFWNLMSTVKLTHFIETLAAIYAVWWLVTRSDRCFMSHLITCCCCFFFSFSFNFSCWAFHLFKEASQLSPPSSTLLSDWRLLCLRGVFREKGLWGARVNVCVFFGWFKRQRRVKKERLKNTTLTFAFLSVTSISHSFPAVSSVLPPFLSSLLSLPFLCLLFQPSALSRFCFLHFAFSLFLSVLFGFPPSPIPPVT